MEPQPVTARAMEDEAQEASRHLEWMRRSFGRKEFYQELLAEIERFAARRKLSDTALELLRRHKDLGIIYVEIDDRFRRMNEEAVVLLTKLLHEDLSGTAGQDSREKWQTFFEKYREEMLKGYKQLISKDPALNTAFEASARKVIESALRKWLDGLRPHEQQYRDEIAFSLSKEMNGFFHHLRSKLSSEIRFDDSLIAETLSKAQVWPGNLGDMVLVDLAVALRGSGLPPDLYEATHLLFSSSLAAEFENKLADLAEKRPPSNRRDIPKLLEGRPFAITEGGLVRLQRIFIRGAEKLVSDSVPELAEIESKLKQSEKKLKTEIVRSFEELNETVSKLPASQENFAKVSSDVKKKLETLEEVLNRNFWSVGELKRRQGVLRERIESAHDLRTLNPQDLKELISRGSDPSKISFERFPEEFRLIKEKNGEGLGLLSKGDRDALNDIVREQLRLRRDDMKIAKKRGEPARHLEMELTMLEELSSTGRRAGKKFDVDELLRRYLRISEEIMEPFCVGKKILDLFKVWPPESSGASPSVEGSSLIEAKYVGEELDYRSRYYRIKLEDREEKAETKPILEIQDNLELREAIISNFREVVSVLVYDIRGSTFMGKRLKNARIESDIRNAFNQEMVRVARVNGAFMLKDTGDGGILFFSGNSKELYDLSYTTVTHDGGSIRQYTLGEEEHALESSPKAAERAVRCAQGMIKAARKFVEENLAKYPNWFRETSERSIFYQGTTYANLPPEYQRIFQIGIGIASGTVDKDLSFGLNSFGDPDITGVLIRDANFYSKARDPRRSVVLCDGATLLNLLLNVERFDSTDRKEAEPSLVSPERGERLLREEVSKWSRLKEERKGFKFSQFGIAIERIGYQLLSGEKLVGKLELALQEDDLFINKFAELMDEKGGEIKVIYEILPEKD
jgi:class 3 adenylate cyclase